MTAQGWLQIALYVAVMTTLTPVLGARMARVYRKEPVLLARVLGPVERLSYRAIRVGPAIQQDWRAYARTTLVFSVTSFLALYLILGAQGIHPFNPESFGSVPRDVTFNTTSSFVTSTNWQFYGGEAYSALYRPAYREELYELARAALFALGSGGAAGMAPLRR